LANKANEKIDNYNEIKDRNIKVENDFVKFQDKDKLFSKGQSARIWNELYKVVDSSDVIVQVLDARNPLGTRSYHVEKHIKDNCPHKHMILILNKCDLIPNWATKRWLYILAKEYPTLAFHASLTKSFGKGSLIQLLRQFQNIHSNKQQISVGFIGYPNVGKSSIINTLKKKKVCNVAPIPGETKVWQYITLYKKIFLIDCPGVVYPSQEESETDIVLKGVVRIDNIKTPSEFIPALLERTKKEYIQRTYGIVDWNTPEEFLEKYAIKSGKLLKKGEPDIEITSRMVLNDWVRGKIPFFVPPPDVEYVEEEKDSKEKSKIDPPKQKVDNIRIKEDFFDEIDQPLNENNKKESEEDNDDIEWDDVNPNEGEIDVVQWEDVNPENNDNKK